MLPLSSKWNNMLKLVIIASLFVAAYGQVRSRRNSSRDMKSDGEKFLFCFRLLRDF